MRKDSHHSDDAKAKMRAAKAGRPGAPKKLTEDQVREMRLLKSQGVKMMDIAKTFGVSRVTVYRTCNGRSWSHVNGQASAVASPAPELGNLEVPEENLAPEWTSEEATE